MLESPKARMLRRLAKQVDEFRHELQVLPVLRLLFQKFEAVALSVAQPSRLVRALDGRLAVEFEQTIRAWLQDFGKALVLRKDRALRKASPRIVFFMPHSIHTKYKIVKGRSRLGGRFFLVECPPGGTTWTRRLQNRT